MAYTASAYSLVSKTSTSSARNIKLGQQAAAQRHNDELGPLNASEWPTPPPPTWRCIGGPLGRQGT
jgi:hypothetical protein